MFIYTLAGGLSGLGGIGLVIRSSSGVPHAGANWELDTIAAIVFGGTRLFGGEGNVFNAMVGVLIYQMIGNIMNLVSLNPYYQDIVKAAVIIVVVGTSVTRNRRRGGEPMSAPRPAGFSSLSRAVGSPSFWQSNASLVILVVFVLFSAILTRGTLLRPSNVATILYQTSTVGVLAISQIRCSEVPLVMCSEARARGAVGSRVEAP